MQGKRRKAKGERSKVQGYQDKINEWRDAVKIDLTVFSLQSNSFCEVLMFYQIINVGREAIGLVWEKTGGKLQIEAVYLPGKEKMAKRIVRDFPAINQTPRAISNGIDQLIADLYNGKKQKFNLALLNFSRVTDFSARVLKQTFKIPCGKAATYSGLAAKVGNLRAARAVGTALANNPFPIIVPCHRVVRADGSLGQFGGGTAMKKQLLEKEQVLFDAQGRVIQSLVQR